MQQQKYDLSHLAERLDRDLAALDLAQRLELISKLGEHPVFTTSLGIEDQVLTWAIADSGQKIEVATLQTGRLFGETLELLETTKHQLGVEIKEYYPDPKALDDYTKTYGVDGFYNSIEARKACCHVRKLVPLAQALKDADIWITGLRRQQSQNRNTIAFAEWDAERHLLKVNPLADWTIEQIREAVATHEIPINPLHGRGYPSIGCEPCTRAIAPGEDERAGRWWWEQRSSRECGLHVATDLAKGAVKPTTGETGISSHG